MNNKEEFQWICARGAEIAHMSQSEVTKRLAFKLGMILDRHFTEVFPEEEERFRQRVSGAKAKQSDQAARLKETGPVIWAELHKRALLPVKDRSAEMKYLHDLKNRLPAGCACKSSHIAYLRATPPDFDHYFEWTVTYHNFVNREKQNPSPEITLEEARKIWS